MSRHAFNSGVALSVFLASCTFPLSSEAQGIIWPIDAGGNGHSYELIEGPTTWTAAKIAAEARGGYLATVTSREENEFIVNVLGANLPNDVNLHLLGGFQHSFEASPASNWQWVTGEPWLFSNWAANPVEPNDFFGPASEQFLMFDEGRGNWNDVGDSWAAIGYILETGDPVPEPSTICLFALAIPFVGLFLRARASG